MASPMPAAVPPVPAPPASPPPPPPASPPPPPAPAATWYSTAVIDPLDVGHMQNKGWNSLEPAAAAAAAIKAHREAEGKLGVPADRVLRRPTPGNAEEGKAFWQQLGAPADPKDYAFEGVDFGDADLNTKFTEHMRATAANLNMPKDMAAEVAKAAFKFIEDQGAGMDAANSTAMIEERRALEQEWGPPESDRFKAQMSIADRAALALGVTQDQLTALKAGIGGVAVAKLFNSLGFRLGEASYIADPNNPQAGVMTVEQAFARRHALTGIDANGQATGKPDQGWMAKLNANDAAVVKEWKDLQRIIGSRNA